MVGFSFFESLAEESLDDESLDDDSLEEESLEDEESFESLGSFLSEEDFSSLALSPAGDFPA